MELHTARGRIVVACLTSVPSIFAFDPITRDLGLGAEAFPRANEQI
jgi:hypothetical protein